MKVSIYLGDNKTKNTGIVMYDELDHSVMITHKDIEVRRAVHEYLTTEKEFTIPYSDEVGSFITVLKKPCESVVFMEMGLCEMYFSIGVHVNWGSPDNEGGSSHPKEPILAKGIFDDTTYKIIGGK